MIIIIGIIIIILIRRGNIKGGLVEHSVYTQVYILYSKSRPAAVSDRTGFVLYTLQYNNIYTYITECIKYKVPSSL